MKRNILDLLKITESKNIDLTDDRAFIIQVSLRLYGDRIVNRVTIAELFQILNRVSNTKTLSKKGKRILESHIVELIVRAISVGRKTVTSGEFEFVNMDVDEVW